MPASLMVWINIESLPTGNLVSSICVSIRLLHNFDDKLFMGSHDPTLAMAGMLL